MAPHNSTKDFKNLLSQFIGESAPLFKMLKWTTEQLMKIEAEGIIGAKKGNIQKVDEHSFLELEYGALICD